MSVLNNIDGTLINTDVTLIKEKLFKKLLDNVVKRNKILSNECSHPNYYRLDYRLNILLRYLREEICALKCCTVKNLYEEFNLNTDEIRLLCSRPDVVSDVDNETYYYWSEKDYGSCSSNIICKTPDVGNISFNINLETAIALLTNQEIYINWFGKQVNLNDFKDPVFKPFIESTINHQTHVTFNNIFYSELKEYCIKHYNNKYIYECIK